MVDKTEIPLSNISNLTQLAVAASVMLLFLAFGSPNNPVELTTTAAPTTTISPTTIAPTTTVAPTTQKPLPTLNPMPSSSPSNSLMFEKTHLDNGNITWDLFVNIGMNSQLLAVYGEYNNPLIFQSNKVEKKSLYPIINNITISSLRIFCAFCDYFYNLHTLVSFSPLPGPMY